eukprot:9482664-Pyramimonas_sp.AAC.1
MQKSRLCIRTRAAIVRVVKARTSELAGKRDVLSNITSSVGVKTVTGVLLPGMVAATGKSTISKLIDKSSGFPAHASVVTCTAHDGQRSARFDVYQGDYIEYPEGSTLLGTLHLRDLPEHPKCSVQFTVSFDVDRDGELSVSAKIHENENHLAPGPKPAVPTIGVSDVK